MFREEDILGYKLWVIDKASKSGSSSPSSKMTSWSSFTFQQWWLFPWLVRSSWRARGWDSTFPLLSDQRSPPSNFHRQDSFIIYQLSFINTSVFTFSLSATSKLKFSSTQGSSGRYLVAYPSNLISPMLQGYVSSYIRLSNVKIIKYQVWSHP